MSLVTRFCFFLASLPFCFALTIVKYFLYGFVISQVMTAFKEGYCRSFSSALHLCSLVSFPSFPLQIACLYFCGHSPATFLLHPHYTVSAFQSFDTPKCLSVFSNVTLLPGTVSLICTVHAVRSLTVCLCIHIINTMAEILSLCYTVGRQRGNIQSFPAGN